MNSQTNSKKNTNPEDKLHASAASKVEQATLQPDSLSPLNQQQLQDVLKHYSEANHFAHQTQHLKRQTRRMTLELPDDLYREIKVYCAQNDLQMGLLVRALLQQCFRGSVN